MGMEFHPEKFNVLRVSRVRSPIQYPCRLKKKKKKKKKKLLEDQGRSKYLAVDVQSSLSWKNHIDRVTKKAKRHCGSCAESEACQ